MAKKRRLDQIPLVHPEDAYFLFQVPSQAIFERGEGWTAPVIEGRRENEILPGKDSQWWKPAGAMGKKGIIELSDTTRKERPWFSSYWDNAISKISRFDEIIWLYEIQARLDGHFAFGKPTSHLSDYGLTALYEVARNTNIAYGGWQRPGSEPLVSRTYGGRGGWSDRMFFPVKMETHGPHVTLFSLNLRQGSENMLLAELRKNGFSGSVGKFRLWLKAQREKHKEPGPARYAQKGEVRQAEPWRYIEAMDDRASGGKPSRVQIQRAFNWYRSRLGIWMQRDSLPFPYAGECSSLEFEDQFKDALNCSETQKLELTKGEWLIEERSKYLRRTQ